MRRVFLTCLFAVSCIAADRDSAFYAAYGDVGNQHYQSKATWTQIEQAPRWSLDADEMPPLPPGRAHTIARKQLERLLPHGQTWYLDAIRIVDGGLRRHWLYEVSFRRD